MAKPMWILADAVSLLSSLEKASLIDGFNLHIGGGVLNKGWSENDLDVFAAPRAYDPYNLDDLLVTFRGVGFTRRSHDDGNSTYTHATAFNYRQGYKLYDKDDRCIDLIFPFMPPGGSPS